MPTFSSKKEERHHYEHHATEKEFLAWYANQELKTYETPSVTVDNVIFAYNPDTNRVNLLLIQRKAHPYLHHWALPGGFLNKNEDTTQAAIREVFEETQVKVDHQFVDQLCTVATPNRDPRSWIVTVAHLVYLPTLPQATAGDDAANAKWFDFSVDSQTNQIHISDIPDSQIAFDHLEILNTAVKRIQGRFDYKPEFLNVLPEFFTLKQVRNLYEQFKGSTEISLKHYNLKRNHAEYLEQTDAVVQGERGKPQRLFKLTSRHL
ncbi:DNA mismatch repair protein MutT [Lactococcus hodotermopsidis]|uniref:DNA mismatch repair protein MutT n=1 Tax=Pseudolactococcus hodotermopsidis TaxID=2709157 RepID=A0A6A0B866_9LACT|nr:NUDIX hydrolase [Lactococcus hodotermopsidis]GFH41550.1 DNA mismatch repair protein MutT [Lactococcus hodotermopsidis]